MAVRWFDTDLEHWPPLIVSIMERVRYYFSQMLYPSLPYVYTSSNPDPLQKAIEEARNSSSKRFILTDITDRALQDASKLFHWSNGVFPFTTFNYGELDLDDTRFNMFANVGHYYEPLVNAKIEARPSSFHLSMITYFATGFDYWRAQSLLNQDSSLKSLLWVPIIINNVTTQIPILLEFEELSKGTYAYEFATQMSTGKIQDIVHDVVINFFDLYVDTNLRPVDDIELALAYFSEQDHRDYAVRTTTSMPNTPTISSTSPEDGSSGVLTNANIIINFSEPMMETYVEQAIYFDPFIDADFIWNSGSTVLIIDPYYNLTSGTMYSGTIYDSAISARGIPIEDDFEFSFTTEGVAPDGV